MYVRLSRCLPMVEGRKGESCETRGLDLLLEVILNDEAQQKQKVDHEWHT